MKSCLTHALFATLLLFANITAVIAQERMTGQEDRIYAVSDETYEKVVELLLPRTVPSEPTVRYAFILRYEPSFEAETQIVIVGRANNNVEIVEYRSADGNIYLKLNELFRKTRREDPAEMAKEIRIEKRTLNMDARTIHRLRKGFYDKLCITLEYESKSYDTVKNEITVTADGTKYSLWYSGLGNMFYDFSGSGINRPTSSDESPLMHWMKVVRREVNKLPASEAK